MEDHQPEGPAPGPGATAPNAPATEADAPAAGPGAPDTDAVGAAGSAPWGADSIVAPGTEPIPDPAVDSPPDAAAGARGPRSTTTPHKKTARRGRKPAIIRAKDPLTRKTLASALDNTDLATTDHAHSDNAAREDASDSPATSESPTAAQTPVLGQLETLWDTGMAESTQYATKLRDVATLAPQADDLDLRDEAEYLIAQALRTTIHHAGRLLADARTATTHLPQLLALLDTGTLPARWFTFILRRSSTLTPHHLTELDHSIADWDLRVDEDRFRRRLNALVQWLHDRDDATPTPPQRSVDIHPPDEDGTACLQLHGPAPEILLGLPASR